MPVESLRFNAIVKDAEIHVRMNDPIAGKKVLEKIIPHIPIVRQDAGLPIKPIGVFNIGYTNGDSLILYTDGEFICLADFSACTKANSALRVFADPSYDAAHAVFRVIKR